MRLTMKLQAALCTALALAACTPAGEPGAASQAASSATGTSAAITDQRRPAEDREDDANRKPAELLAFTQVAPGERVGDFIMGGGYITRLLAVAVGPEGRVYGFQPGGGGEAQQALAAQYDNVELVGGTVPEPAFPQGLDMIITAQNLHDLYTERNPPGTAQQALASLHRALKPGGRLVVIDHAALENSETSVVGTLHRIERTAALEALEAAGFTLADESQIYARTDDPGNVPVFDPAVRGRTNQFALLMKKEE
jgi:predicted methyltransferase